jgi:hypothetical protein
MLTAPALPPVAEPEPTRIDPVVPELDVPELKDRSPLTPLVPAFAVAIVMAPLVLAMPWPLVTPIAPPVRTVLSPAATVIKPPVPLKPVPTVMLTAPALPSVAAPVPRKMAPEEPEFDVPELNESRPLTPLSPAFEVRIVIAPLVLAIPWPLAKLMAPPVWTVL